MRKEGVKRLLKRSRSFKDAADFISIEVTMTLQYLAYSSH